MCACAGDGLGVGGSFVWRRPLFVRFELLLMRVVSFGKAHENTNRHTQKHTLQGRWGGWGSGWLCVHILYNHTERERVCGVRPLFWRMFACLLTGRNSVRPHQPHRCEPKAHAHTIVQRRPPTTGRVCLIPQMCLTAQTHPQTCTQKAIPDTAVLVHHRHTHTHTPAQRHAYAHNVRL